MQAALARMQWRRPIVFIMRHGDIPTTVRAIQAGAVDFLTKPVPPTRCSTRFAMHSRATQTDVTHRSV
jgi:FixJ family two-component response regulator